VGRPRNGFLQIGSRILNSGRAEISSYSFDRVGQTLGAGAIILCQSRGDALGGIGLSFRELAQKL
jgi:hypothetical protein